MSKTQRSDSDDGFLPVLALGVIAGVVLLTVAAIAWAAIAWAAVTSPGETPADKVKLSAQRADVWVKVADQHAAAADVNLSEVARRACPQGQRLVDWQPTNVDGTTVGLAGRCEPGPAAAWFSVVDRHSAAQDARVAALLNGACPDNRVDTWQPVLRSGTTVGALGVCQPVG